MPSYVKYTDRDLHLRRVMREEVGAARVRDIYARRDAVDEVHRKLNMGIYAPKPAYNPPAVISSAPYRADPRSAKAVSIPASSQTIDGVVVKSSHRGPRITVRARKLAARAAATARRLHPALRALDAALEVFSIQVGNPNGYYEVPPGWAQSDFANECQRAPTHNAFEPTRMGNGTPWRDCLGGQAYHHAELSPLGSPAPAWAYGLHMAIKTSPDRITVVRVYDRFNFESDAAPVYHPATSIFETRMVESAKRGANASRFANPTPQPVPEASYHPAPAPAAQPIAVVVTNSAGMLPPTIAPHASKYPGKGTKERKTSSKLGVALFRILDGISEASEVVDALYRALPDDVQKKWGCGKIDRGMVDSAGQYGIDAADCKLKALYHNWHKLDLQEGVTNIVVNEIEDRLYGASFKARNEITFRGRNRGGYKRRGFR